MKARAGLVCVLIACGLAGNPVGALSQATWTDEEIDDWSAKITSAKITSVFLGAVLEGMPNALPCSAPLERDGAAPTSG